MTLFHITSRYIFKIVYRFLTEVYSRICMFKICAYIILYYISIFKIFLLLKHTLWYYYKAKFVWGNINLVWGGLLMIEI